MVDGGQFVFEGGEIASRAFTIIDGGEIVFTGGEVVRGPWRNIDGGVIIFDGGEVQIILRGGGQSTVEWDWVRGKVK